MDSNRPFFSVVLITYNRVDLLPRCIESVLNQTFENFELVIVDNHSDDGSIDLINNYARNDERIKVKLVHNNNILAYSRNEGIKMSRGKYICMLDSDDWYASDKLQSIFNEAMRSDSDVYYHKYTVMSVRGKERVINKQLQSDNVFFELLSEGNIICNATTVVKKSSLESVGYLSEDPKLRAVEDFDLWLRLAHSGFKFNYINKMLGYYWIGNNISYSPAQINQVNNLYDKFRPLIEPKNLLQIEVKKKYINARIYHKIGYWNDALALYKDLSNCCNPYRKIPIAVLICMVYLKIKF